MNIISDIGNAIIDNQDGIKLGIIVVVLILVLIFLIKGISNGRKKRDILAKINENVSQINTTVNSLEGKKPDVIYIDNRTSDNRIPVEKEPCCEETPFAVAEDAEQDKVVEQAEETVKETKVHFDRNCGVDKDGKVYTVEELYKQIKE